MGLAAASPFVTECQSQHVWVHQSSLTPPRLTEQHTLPTAKKSVNASILADVPKAKTASLPIPAGTPTVRATTLARCAQNGPELQRAHTPLRHSQFERELAHHPDKAFTLQLRTALQHGVDIGYKGPVGPNDARNLPSALQHPQIIDAELAKECAAGRILGPFHSRPLKNLRCSGIGVVPKKNKWRMIMHLSAPAGNNMNDFISKDDFSLHYTSIDDAVKILLSLGRGARMAKVDLKSAFRMIPVRKEDWQFLGIRWRGRFYVDTCLPFGLRSAPFLFNQFADVLAWILQNNYGLHWLIHYLDDYFLAGPPNSTLCENHLHCFLRVCKLLGFPVALDKVEGPATILTFLGLELDSVLQQIRLPRTKLNEILEELTLWLQCRKTTKRQLLSLIGKLAFAARAVPAGRLFLRRLITVSTKVRCLHHQLRLNKEAKADILWWHSFLPTWNGTAAFLDPETTDAHDLELFTDASGTLGCGAYFQGSWFHYSWQPHQRLSPKVSIQWQELFAILAATLTWGHKWQRKRIKFNCDNQAIVLAWQGKSSKEQRIMCLLRMLFLTAAQHNFTVTLSHLPGQHNTIADALSRCQFTRFFALAPQADPTPTAMLGILSTL